MSSFNPNTTTVGEACSKLARMPLAESRGLFAELSRLGIVPVPVVEYLDEQFPAFMLSLAQVTSPFIDINVTAGGFGVVPEIGSVIEFKGLYIWNPGNKTAAGLITLTLNSLLTLGDSSGPSNVTTRRRDAGPDSKFFPDGGSANNLATAARTRLWSGQVWVPAALGSALPLFIDFGDALELEGPSLTVLGGVGIGNLQGVQLVASGTVAGLTNFAGALVYTERPPGDAP